MSDVIDKLYEGITLAEAYAELDSLPAQTYVDIMPGLQIKRKANGIPIMRLHYSAIPDRNPALNPEWKKIKKSQSTVSGWDREQEINDEAGGGDKVYAAVLSMFADKIIITDPRWAPMEWWDVVGGFDHGTTSPTTLLKAYLDESGNIYVCGEFYQMKTETHENHVWQNSQSLLAMPDLCRARWVHGDPSIFKSTQTQVETGSTAGTIDAYRKVGVRFISEFPGERENLVFEERLHERWQDLANKEPTLFIVCRNESDRRQPGLHPYDCPNLLWELRRIHRKQMTSRQLLVNEPSAQVVDKNDHAVDALKYILMSLPRPTKVPIEHKLAALVQNLDPTSAAIAASRFMNMQRQSQRPANLRRKGRMR